MNTSVAVLSIVKSQGVNKHTEIVTRELSLVKCAHCGKAVEKKQAAKLVIGDETHSFHLYHIRKVAQRLLSHIALSKAFAEIFAIGTGAGGIAYTLLGFTDRALIMDTFSAIAAIAALFVGIEHLR
ncbi:MAG: hypothetical protein JSW72_09975 [Candidatus Bathyarchaeota archaeon]|nr:MAG: hypothetical protein JSW72_09975 [Candidatus Bathyarchaeota archaeon]